MRFFIYYLLWIGVLSCVTPDDGSHSGILMKKGGITCLYLTPENKVNPFNICYDDRNFDFKLGEKRFQYAISDYKGILQNYLRAFFSRTGISIHSLEVSKVDLWVSYQWDGPLHLNQITKESPIQVVAVVHSPSGRVAVFFPFLPDYWNEPERILWLGENSYPSKFAKEPGKLLVYARLNQSEEAVKAFLKETGVFSSRSLSKKQLVFGTLGGYPYFQLQTLPFMEPFVARLINEHPKSKDYIRAIKMVPGFENDGAKAKFYSFSF